MKHILTAAGLAFATVGAAQASDDVKLQLKWVTQAQFAGYYVAQDKGFYGEEDLNVTILPGGPDIAPTQVIAGGGADVTVEWMPAALAAREKGLPLVNIAQPYKSSGMQLTCWKDAGIKTPADLSNRTLGVWFFGNEFPFMSWMSKMGISTEAKGEMGVEVLKQGFNVDPLLQRQADCISTMTYNEYWQVIDSGVDAVVSCLHEDNAVNVSEKKCLEVVSRGRDSHLFLFKIKCVVVFIKNVRFGKIFVKKCGGMLLSKKVDVYLTRDTFKSQVCNCSCNTARQDLDLRWNCE